MRMTQQYPYAWLAHADMRNIEQNDGKMPLHPVSKEAAWRDFERIQLIKERNIRIFRGLIRPRSPINATVQ